MGKVVCDISASADGFSAGHNQTEERPFGEGDTRMLHSWMFETPEAGFRARRFACDACGLSPRQPPIELTRLEKKMGLRMWRGWSLVPTFMLIFAACTAAVSAAPAQPAAEADTRAEAVEVVRGLREIVTPGGVELLQKVRIGGIDQWVSVRGHDKRNPVLLVLHGGPGWVAMPMSWHVARGWEEYFTVVQWDQRGAGKTFVENGGDALAPTMTLDRMLTDTEEMVQWTRQEFGQDRIVLLGHSWGSILGLTVAERHPQWFHAYVGVGQGINIGESERRGWRWAMEQAKQNADAEAVAELQSIAPYAQREVEIPLQHVLLQRKWVSRFGGAAYNRPNASFEGAAVKLAPEYSDEDVRRVWDAQDFSIKQLLNTVLSTDLRRIRELDVPLILFLGRHDHNVASTVAAEWFATVRAPSKRLVWFEHSAHELMAEEPGKTLVSLVEHVLPHARAGLAAKRPVRSE